MMNARLPVRYGGLWLVAMLFFLTGTVGCRQSSGGIPVDQSNASGLSINLATADGASPPMGRSILRISLTDEAGDPVEGAAVSLRGDMNHAGMVPVEATASDLGAGIYEADFEWTMAGDWQVTVRAETAAGNIVVDTFDFAVTGD